MADVQGTCDLPLTRAIVQYRDVHERDLPGGRIQDFGIGLVLDGRYASAAQVIDLGSGVVREMDLSAELVILDWVYEPTLEHVHELLLEDASSGGSSDPDATGDASTEGGDLIRYCNRLGLGVIERLGFSYLTRPVLLRLGFRDICQDLDLHEGTAFRVLMGKRRVARIHMDYDSGALVIRTGRSQPDPDLQAALDASFPDGELRRGRAVGPTGTVWYQLRLPLPLTVEETHHHLKAVRTGIEGLIARFEPARFRAIRDLQGALGPRETLSTLHLRETLAPTEPVLGLGASASTVH
jgi:hypothetical protein